MVRRARTQSPKVLWQTRKRAWGWSAPRKAYTEPRNQVVMDDNAQTRRAAPKTVDTAPEDAALINVAGGQPEIIPDRESDQLKIALGEFEGPLDLLLYLVRQEQ